MMLDSTCRKHVFGKDSGVTSLLVSKKFLSVVMPISAYVSVCMDTVSAENSRAPEVM
jgi:hypothetical protein